MANIYDMTDTWNNGATTFTAIKMDVSDAASAANSLLLDLKVDGVTKASIDKAGNLTANFTLTAIDNVPIGATTPSTGAFTTLMANGLTLSNATTGYTLDLDNSGTGEQKYLSLSSGATVLGDLNRPNGTNDVELNANFGSVVFGTGSGGTATERARINSVGNTYLKTGGSANTTHSFVFNENGGEISLHNAAGGTDILFDSLSGYGRLLTFNGSLQIGTVGAHQLVFNTYAAERARIDSAGTLITNHNIREKIYNLTGTDINPVNGAIQYKTLGANTTFTESLSDGDSVILRLSGGDTYTVTYPTMTWVTSAGNTAPTLGGSDVIVIWQESSVLYGAYVGSYA